MFNVRNKPKSTVKFALIILTSLLFTLFSFNSANASPISHPDNTQPQVSNQETVELTIYVREDCVNCEALDEWLTNFLETRPTVKVTELEIADNTNQMIIDGRRLGFTPGSSPTTILQDRVWIGFTEQIGNDLGISINKALKGETIPSGVFGLSGAGTCDDELGQCGTGGSEGTTQITIPIIGEVSLSSDNLILSTIIIGFVDGVNPCSLWVISILLTIIVRTGSRKRVLAIGSTFLAITAAMYGLYMFGLYSVLSVVSHLQTIQLAVATIALIFGIVSAKDYFAFKKGPSFTIKDSAKPGLYKRIRDAAGKKSLVTALGATTVLAVLVSLLETPCTAGFPIIWTGMLHANGVAGPEAFLLFILYMTPFLLDEFIVFLIVVYTMKATKLQENHAELLKLVGGVTMIALAVSLVVDPTLMENPISALVLFTSAFVLSWLIHISVRFVKSRKSQKK